MNVTDTGGCEPARLDRFGITPEPHGPMRAGPRQVASPGLSFGDYVHVRKYDYGRGTPAAWALIARLRGEADLSHFHAWRDLRAWLEGNGASEADLAVGRTVWRSYVAYRGQRRRALAEELSRP